MQRSLYIFLLLYFPLLLAAGAELKFDFRPDAFGSPLFRFLAWAWLIAGAAGLVAGIGVLSRIIGARFTAEHWRRDLPLSLLGVVLGVPPAYILFELVLKIIQFYSL